MTSTSGLYTWTCKSVNVRARAHTHIHTTSRSPGTNHFTNPYTPVTRRHASIYIHRHTLFMKKRGRYTMQILQQSKKINYSVIPVKTPKRAGKTVQCLCSVPEPMCKSQLWWGVLTIAVRGGRNRRPQGLASQQSASQPSLTGKPWSWETLSQKPGWTCLGNDTQSWPLGLHTHLHMGACVPNIHTYTYTSKEKN